MPRCVTCNACSETDPEHSQLTFVYDDQVDRYVCSVCYSYSMPDIFAEDITFNSNLLSKDHDDE